MPARSAAHLRPTGDRQKLPITKFCLMISFIVPAHNEELWLGQCLSSIAETMKGMSEKHEVIVVDDASTDATSQIAAQFDVRVIQVDYRKISAVRNAGVSASVGDLLFFVDADTKANAPAVKDALKALRSGAVGGGCVPDLDGPVPLWGHLLHRIAVLGGRIVRLVGGCFLFCTRDAFRSAGGFSEDLRAGEDIAFVRELKRIGEFVVLRPAVVTSARKLEIAGPWQVIRLLSTIAFRGHRYENPWVIDILYGQRAQKCRNPGNVAEPAEARESPS